MSRTGVLLMGFGGPDSLEAVGPFMCNLMGREPSAELVERVQARYDSIGGASPLPEIASQIAQALERELADKGRDAPVRVGMAYWHPFVAEGLGELRALGVDRVVTISLSPFESKAATGACRDAVSAEAGGLEVVEAPMAGTLASFVEAHAAALRNALAGGRGPSVVVFTAHSLPVADLAEDDEYVAGLRRTADAIAESLGWASGVDGGGTVGPISTYGTTAGRQPWLLAYQSKGQRPGEWLGPELDDIIDAAAQEGVRSIVVSPIGFVTDHMETLYDLDIVAASRAEKSGISFVRSQVPNADSALVAEMAAKLDSLIPKG